jgi:hypothetical protein
LSSAAENFSGNDSRMRTRAAFCVASSTPRPAQAAREIFVGDDGRVVFQKTASQL